LIASHARGKTELKEKALDGPFLERRRVSKKKEKTEDYPSFP